MQLRDRNILGRIQRGDVKSFELIFHRYYQGMLLYARSLVKKENVAEEIVQDVFYNIWKNRQNFKLTNNWKSYLYGAVYKNSLYYLRKMKREQPLEQSMLATEKGIGTSPEDEINYRELNERIKQTLNELPQRTGEIFRLSRFEGLTYPEIARKLAISVKTVEANMGKALKAFRSSLKEYGYVK